MDSIPKNVMLRFTVYDNKIYEIALTDEIKNCKMDWIRFSHTPEQHNLQEFIERKIKEYKDTLRSNNVI